MEEDKSSLFLWVIGGGAIVVGLVMAMKGSPGGTTIVSSGSGAAASAIAENNTAYNTAALAAHTADVKSVTDLEAIRLGYKTAITTNAQQNEANYKLAQIESDFTLKNNQETFDAAQKALAESDQNQLSITQLQTQADIQKANIDSATQRAISDNQTTQARIAKGSSFGNFLSSALGAVTSIFGGKKT